MPETTENTDTTESDLVTSLLAAFTALSHASYVSGRYAAGAPGVTALDVAGVQAVSNQAQVAFWRAFYGVMEP